MHKLERQQRLLKLIADSKFSKQSELAELLAAEGFSVTQASVSRDLDELGIVKRGGRYVRSGPQRARDLGDVTFENAGSNLIVGHCDSGLASAVTVRIDARGIAGIVGTIAGDDTVFIAVQDERSQRSVRTELEMMFG